MGTIENDENPDIFADDLVLSETMKVQLRQICIYARIVGIDLTELRELLIKEDILPCKDKNASKKALARIYDDVACSF
jgi:hypothetical protein